MVLACANAHRTVGSGSSDVAELLPWAHLSPAPMFSGLWGPKLCRKMKIFIEHSGVTQATIKGPKQQQKIARIGKNLSKTSLLMAHNNARRVDPSEK